MEPSADHLPKHSWDMFKLNSAHLFAIRDNSMIFRCPSEFGELAVKCCLDAATGQADLQGAQREFDSLQRLYRAALDAGMELAIPKPIGLLKEEGILAMTWEAGQPMTAMLLSGTKQSAGQCGSAAGEWLRRFHQLHPLAAQTSDFRGKLDFISREVDRRRPRHDPLLQLAKQLLEQNLDAAEAVPLPVSWIFSDFKSDNLLVREGRAVALDAQLQYENTVIHDIVPFLIHLELLRWSPRGLFRWRALAHAGKSFLTAYSSSVGEWRLPIAWLKTEMLLQRGIAIAKATSLGGYVRRATIRRALACATNNLKRF